MDTSAETGIEDWNELDYMKVRISRHILPYLGDISGISCIAYLRLCNIKKHQNEQ